MSSDVQLERRGPIGLVTLDRPRELNALDLGMLRAIHSRLDAWARMPEVKAVVIRGAGGKAFCAGGDVRPIRPRWNPAMLAEVRDEDVEACFTPLGEKEWRP